MKAQKGHITLDYAKNGKFSYILFHNYLKSADPWSCIQINFSFPFLSSIGFIMSYILSTCYS